MPSLTLLTIDDEPQVRRSIRSFFEDSDFQVLEAENGRIGVEMFRIHKPDIVLVDLRMPEMDGMEVTRIIHRESPETPLIIVSGTGLIENAIQAIREGAWDYVTKPVIDMMALEHIVDRNLERARLIKENNAYHSRLETLVEQRTTELNRAVDHLKIINRRLTGAVETTLQLQGFETIDAFAGFLMQRFREQMNVSGGAFYLTETKGLRRIASLDPGHAPDFIPFPLRDRSVLADVMKSGRSRLLDMADKECDFPGSGWDGYHDGSCMVFPLSGKAEEPLGVITLHNRKDKPFIAQDHEIASILSSFSSAAIRAIRFSNDIREKELIFKLLAKSVAGVSEQEMFTGIVKVLAEIVQADQAMIGFMDGEGTCRTTARIRNGKVAPNTVYPIKGTPCETVLREGYCILPENLAASFDPSLLPEPMEAYVGVALKDKDDATIGLLSAQNKAPLELPDFIIEILDILAVKGSAALERRREREARRQLLENLQQAQKMEAIGTLAGGIAHDFNNILSPIMGYAELLQISLEGDGALQAQIHGILDATYRARDLVQQILTFSRKKEHKKQAITLHPSIKEAMKMLRATLPTTIEIRERITTTTRTVLADQTQIHQMVMNLCTNAFHAMEAHGGILEVELNNQHLPAQNPLSAPEGDYVRLTVRDTGQGISNDILERIFDPYFTTKAEGKGTGLGLAVLHGIVSSHQGYVTVDSTVGKGTAFHVFLPALKADGAGTVMDSSRTDLKKGSGHILLVDDQTEVLEVMSAMLTRLGYRTTAIDDSRKALACFEENPEAFDLVITDQTMPNLPGLQLANRLLALRPDIPIVLCSGYDDTLLKRDLAMETGIKAFETKPVDMHRLAGLTARLVARKN